MLEYTGVGAYIGAGLSLMNKAYLGVAGSIVQIEARHAAAIGLLTGKSVTPNGALTSRALLAGTRVELCTLRRPRCHDRTRCATPMTRSSSDAVSRASRQD